MHKMFSCKRKKLQFFGVFLKSASKNDLRICDNSEKVTTGSWLSVDYTTSSLLDCSYF